MFQRHLQGLPGCSRKKLKGQGATMRKRMKSKRKLSMRLKMRHVRMDHVLSVQYIVVALWFPSTDMRMNQ